MLAAAAIPTPIPHLLPYLSQQIDFSQKTAPFLVKKLLFLVSWNSSLKTGKLSSFQPLSLPPHIDKIILRWDENRLITEFSFGAAWERPPLHWLADRHCMQSEMLMQLPSADDLHTSVIHYCEAFRSQRLYLGPAVIVSSLYLVFTLRV